LLELVVAARAASGFARGLDGWKQQCHQDTDNRDDNQQLDQGKAATERGSPHEDT
jgi:hypothetical protein